MVDFETLERAGIVVVLMILIADPSPVEKEVMISYLSVVFWVFYFVSVVLLERLEKKK